jgi:hypothetical protein
MQLSRYLQQEHMAESAVVLHRIKYQVATLAEFFSLIPSIRKVTARHHLVFP